MAYRLVPGTPFAELVLGATQTRSKAPVQLSPALTASATNSARLRKPTIVLGSLRLIQLQSSIQEHKPPVVPKTGGAGSKELNVAGTREAPKTPKAIETANAPSAVKVVLPPK